MLNPLLDQCVARFYVHMRERAVVLSMGRFVLLCGCGVANPAVVAPCFVGEIGVINLVS